MTRGKLRVMVVDDDFMIANLHGKYIEQQEGYELAGVAHNYEQTISGLKELKPDLLLLDVYLPDHSGIEALRTIRAGNLPCDIILITASKELPVIEEAFRLGIFDYLIKPFDLSLLKETLEKYRRFKVHLQSSAQPDQKFVDGLKKLRATASSVSEQVPKGIDTRTLERIKEIMLQDRNYHTADQFASMTGLSRSTARAYLDFLVTRGIAEEFLQYGAVGRPQRLFRIKSPLP